MEKYKIYSTTTSNIFVVPWFANLEPILNFDTTYIQAGYKQKYVALSFVVGK